MKNVRGQSPDSPYFSEQRLSIPGRFAARNLGSAGLSSGGTFFWRKPEGIA